jgi:hypothetical protein
VEAAEQEEEEEEEEEEAGKNRTLHTIHMLAGASAFGSSRTL